MPNYTIPSILGDRVLPWAGDYFETGCVSPVAQSNKMKSNSVQYKALTIAALKLLEVTNVALGTSICVLGSSTQGDGLGAVYYYDPSSTATADDVNVVAPTIGAGRWLIARLRSTLEVKEYSVIGNANLVASQISYYVPVNRAVTFPVDLVGSRVVVQTAPSSEVVLSIRKNGVEFATATFGASGSVATLDGSAATFNGATDDLTIVAPSNVYGADKLAFALLGTY
jgi:hypothetical protein